MTPSFSFRSGDGTTVDPLGKPFLEGLFRAAVEAADAGRLVRGALHRSSSGIALSAGTVSSVIRREELGNVFLVGGGKAGRAMGESACEVLGGRVTAGVLAVSAGSGGEEGPVRYIEGGHPVPDDGSRRAAGDMTALLTGAGKHDLVVALISGGGSAMISAPAQGVPPGDKEAVLRLLLRSGADIVELNTVRKHLSRVKGGQMAAAARPSRVWALLLSDVPGDDPSVIASGPFSPDPTTFADAQKVLVRRGICAEIPHAVRVRVETGLAGRAAETPKPGDPSFAGVTCTVIGSNRTALDAAMAAAVQGGAGPVRILPGFLRGEARECARTFVSELRTAAAATPEGRTGILAAGGETTVTVRGGGRGGRNQEFALAAAIELDGGEGLAVLSAGTDGVDGPTDAAGGYVRGDTCARARSAGVDPLHHLADNDSHSFFRALSDLVVTGPTGTNVADIALGAFAGTKRR